MSEEDRFSPRGFFETLTYSEIHAFGVGLGVLFLAAFANSEELFFVYLGIATMVLRDRSGSDSDGENENENEGEGEGQPNFAFHQKLMDHIRREFHYYMAGGIAGDRLGAMMFRATHGTWPSYYEHIPDIVDALLGGII